MNETISESASVRQKRDRDSTSSDIVPAQTSVFKRHGKRQKLAIDEASEIIYCPVPTNVEVIEIDSDEPGKQTNTEKAELNLKTLSDVKHDSKGHCHSRSHSPSSASSDDQLSLDQQDFDPTSVHVTQQRVFVSAHEKYYSAAYAHLAEKHAEELHDLIFNHVDKKGLNISESDDESDEGRDREPLVPKEGIKHTEEHSDHIHSHGDDNDNVHSQDKHDEERVRRGSPDYRPDANHLAQTNTFAVNVPNVHDYDNTQHSHDQAHSQYRYDTERSHRDSYNYGYETYDDRRTPLDQWHEKERHDSFHNYHRSPVKDWHEQDRQESSPDRRLDPLNSWHEDNQRNSFHENHYTRAEDWHDYDRRNSSRDYRYTSYDDWHERDHRNSSPGYRHTQHEDWHEQDHRDSFHDHHGTQHEDWYERDRRAHGYHHGRDSYAEYYHEENYGRYHSRDHDAGRDHDEDYHGHYRGRDNRAHHHNGDDHGLGRERDYRADYSREDDRGHHHGQDNHVDRHDEDPFVMHHRGKEECDYARREYDRGFYHEEDDYVQENPYTTDENRHRRQSSISSTGAKSTRSLVDTINLPHLKMGVFPLHATRIFVPAPSNAALAMEHHEWAILITSALADVDVVEIASPRRQSIRYDLARYIGRLLSRHLLSAVPLRPLPTQPGGHPDPVKIVLGYASREGREDALEILQKERPYLMSEHSRLELSAWKLEGENKLQPGTACVKWCEREYNGYQAGLKEAENIENAMDGVLPGYGRWWGRDGMFHITSE